MKNLFFLKIITLVLVGLPLIFGTQIVYGRDFGGLFPVTFQLNTDRNTDTLTDTDLIDCDLHKSSKDPDCHELQLDDTVSESEIEPLPAYSFERNLNFPIIMYALVNLRQLFIK